MNSIPKLPYTNSKGGLKVTDNNNQADGFSVAEKSGSNLIVGKMVKFTIDGKYKADKADTLPDYTRSCMDARRRGSNGRTASRSSTDNPAGRSPP